mgnify:CR=1 FL=1
METKYRDIADGNTSGDGVNKLSSSLLETKYRDIADGNATVVVAGGSAGAGWKPSTAI